MEMSAEDLGLVERKDFPLLESTDGKVLGPSIFVRSSSDLSTSRYSTELSDSEKNTILLIGAEMMMKLYPNLLVNIIHQDVILSRFGGVNLENSTSKYLSQNLVKVPEIEV